MKLPEKIKDWRKLNRRQIIKIAAVAVGLYLIVWAVNFTVLWVEINTSNPKINTQRNTVDKMLPGVKAGTRILDSDLKSHKAIGRIGEFYLMQSRFDQLSKTQKAVIGKVKLTDDQAYSITSYTIMNRMVAEPIVYQYAKDHHLTASQAEIGPRLAANVERNGSVEKLQEVLMKNYSWTLTDFKNEIEYSILQAKMEESLGGAKFAETIKANLSDAKVPKVRAYADQYARTHTNYLIDGGYKTLAKRFLSL